MVFATIATVGQFSISSVNAIMVFAIIATMGQFSISSVMKATIILVKETKEKMYIKIS